MQSVVSPELDYQAKIPSMPKYEWTRLFPQSGTTNTTLTAAGGNDII